MLHVPHLAYVIWLIYSRAAMTTIDNKDYLYMWAEFFLSHITSRDLKTNLSVRLNLKKLLQGGHMVNRFSSFSITCWTHPSVYNEICVFLFLKSHHMLDWKELSCISAAVNYWLILVQLVQVCLGFTHFRLNWTKKSYYLSVFCQNLSFILLLFLVSPDSQYVK